MTLNLFSLDVDAPSERYDFRTHESVVSYLIQI